MVSLPAIASTTVTSPRQPNTQSSGIVIEIQPSEDNVDAGNRSGNSANVTITTASREVSTSVSREQAIDGLNRRFQRQAINQLDSNQGINPLRLRALQQSNINADDVSEIATLRRQRELANTFLTNSAANTVQNPGNSGNATGNTGTDLYINAVNAYIRQTLLFSSKDSATSQFSTTA